MEITEDIMSINTKPQKITAGSRGTILSRDDYDNSTNVIFDGYDETQWIHARDIEKMRPDDEVQVSPSENLLSNQYKGWAFFENQPLCCGLMPKSMENCLIRLFYQHSCTKVRDASVVALDSRGISGQPTANPSAPNPSAPNPSAPTLSEGEGSEPATVADESSAELKEVENQIRALQRQAHAIREGATPVELAEVSVSKVPGKNVRLGKKDARRLGDSDKMLTLEFGDSDYPDITP